ncbi:hypothetical protein ElyMa_003190200 [Elysia marginata]|uniref:Uncharacterized protein n=1 Tax=Elysia marginata TaxID=1093978 RepID=A0AAV4J1M3_9GAST|nr:hypothetical protein ElyMa_003190200 [Elysia marginata]
MSEFEQIGGLLGVSDRPSWLAGAVKTLHLPRKNDGGGDGGDDEDDGGGDGGDNDDGGDHDGGGGDGGDDDDDGDDGDDDDDDDCACDAVSAADVSYDNTVNDYDDIDHDVDASNNT